MSTPQGAKDSECKACGFTYGTHDKDCPMKIAQEILDEGETIAARSQAAANLCSQSTREAFTTKHDQADALKEAMSRHRKVLGSLGIEWVKFDHAELVVDQLTTMYRQALQGEQSAISEIERVQQAMGRQSLHIQHLKKLTEEYRGKLDALAAEGLRLKRTGRNLQRKLQKLQPRALPVQRKTPSAKRPTRRK